MGYCKWTRRKLKKPVFLENNANVAVILEYIYNGYEGLDGMIVITLEIENNKFNLSVKKIWDMGYTKWW